MTIFAVKKYVRFASIQSPRKRFVDMSILSFIKIRRSLGLGVIMSRRRRSYAYSNWQISFSAIEKSIFMCLFISWNNERSFGEKGILDSYASDLLLNAVASARARNTWRHRMQISSCLIISSSFFLSIRFGSDFVVFRMADMYLIILIFTWSLRFYYFTCISG